MLLFLLINILAICFVVSSDECGCDKLNREDEMKKWKESDASVCQIQRNEYEDIMKNEDITDMAYITAGEYFIGTNNPIFRMDRESPQYKLELNAFYIDKYEVSNEKFLAFVESTNHITEAEKFGDSFVFQSLLSAEIQEKYRDFRVVSAPWWFKVNNTSWQHPNGPASTLDGLWSHAVVHVTWNDAVAYCKWAGKRLPTEAEWEASCRGGKREKLFPWGNNSLPKGEHWMNIWQGDFPDVNTMKDGYLTTCPVDRFRQNAFDIYNIVGNVWEWTADLWDPVERSKNDKNAMRVKKGGSYLCHQSYCYRYRCAARSQNTADSSAGNLGFRCARNV